MHDKRTGISCTCICTHKLRCNGPLAEEKNLAPFHVATESKNHRQLAKLSVGRVCGAVGGPGLFSHGYLGRNTGGKLERKLCTADLAGGADKLCRSFWQAGRPANSRLLLFGRNLRFFRLCHGSSTRFIVFQPCCKNVACQGDIFYTP